MLILGICDSQDAGAVCLNTEGMKVSAVNEERLSRIKLQGGFPACAVREVLRLQGITPGEVTLVAAASMMTPSWILRSFPSAHARLRGGNKQFSTMLSLYMLYQVVARASVVFDRLETTLSGMVLRRKLKKLGIKARLVMVEHHTAHAYAAYATSDFDEALVFTIDGLGDGISFTVSIGRGGKLTRIFQQQAFNDITLFYSRLTEFLGFSPIRDEGKVMGLAGYCRDLSLLPEAEKLLRVKNGRFCGRNLFFRLSKDRKIFRRLKNKPRESVAASFQTHLEREIVKLVRYWITRTGIGRIALSGGFFANIKVNQRIAEMEEVREVYVVPHMGDGGLALGAVYALTRPRPQRPDTVFWGPAFSAKEIISVLQEMKLRFEQPDDLEREVAGHLSRGKIIARFSGAMEFGPRALGNRSILASASDRRMHARLNAKLSRDEFMPFAPVILREAQDLCCREVNKSPGCSRFMNISCECTEYFKTTCPAVVHEDGTTRPQFIGPDDNPGLYAILAEYRNITGIPALINTSFNIHEEPIVCTPAQACAAFRKAKLDYLVLDRFLVRME